MTSLKRDGIYQTEMIIRILFSESGEVFVVFFNLHHVVNHFHFFGVCTCSNENGTLNEPHFVFNTELVYTEAFK